MFLNIKFTIQYSFFHRILINLNMLQATQTTHSIIPMLLIVYFRTLTISLKEIPKVNFL